MKKVYTSIEAIENDIALTPWQKDIEKTIFTKCFVLADQQEMYRQFVTLVVAMEGRQHWAGDRYTELLLERAQNFIKRVS